MTGRPASRGRGTVQPLPPLPSAAELGAAQAEMPGGLAGVDFYIDISPLMHAPWTGIGWVTARLALYFLDRFPEHVMLYSGHKVLDSNAVRIAITRSPGAYLSVLDQEDLLDLCPLQERRAQSVLSVGIFPNIKRFHRFFDLELSIFHDISPMLMPEVHYQPVDEIGLG